MAIFDGHNDLLLNLWLHHREDPVTAFFAGVENGHLDYPRILQGGLAGGLFALFVPPQEYIARMAPQYASQAWDPLTILWQQLVILKAICAHDASRARLCLSAADIERCRQDKALAMVAHIEGAGGFDAQGDDLQDFYRAGCAASVRSGISLIASAAGSPAPFPAARTAGRVLPARASRSSPRPTP
ncbi:dipeptidase [Klebsiella quasipneumoniae]|nr:dipeptidase [Klebsiella quasipneumoniae]